MRVVITGATGNVGTSLVEALATEDEVTEIVGIARRRPEISVDKVTWHAADVARDDLSSLVTGAGCVVHLGWAIQPSRDVAKLRAINVGGSRRVFAAAADAGVPALVYASSVGAYSPGPTDGRVDESWPTDGVPTSFYSTHKAETERMLDSLESEHPGMRIVRLRPGLIFKREAAEGQRRLFAGPLLPSFLIRRAAIPAVPNLQRLRFQAVHSYDVADAYRRAIAGSVRGPFNIAAEPVIDGPRLGELLGARPVPFPERAARAGAAITWRLHLQPTPEGWVDMGLNAPVMDTSRARRELGWEPVRSSLDALSDILEGLRERASFPTPPLARATSGRFRIKEMVTGVGRT